MLRNGLEPWHLLIVALVVILLFGSKKLPDTARALGKSLRILKSETKAMKEDDGTPPTAAYAPGPQEPAETPRTIHAAPGAAATSTTHTGTTTTGTTTTGAAPGGVGAHADREAGPNPAH
ncbi:twin-arginine translocase TatA/TatE family subunit [Streptomyces sp. CB02959]|uniref:Sec-independent protein translocase subunit TatA n=1 Tax=Streptomyces sp. CB02959 TaxID=2020330 RepID=UPI000C27E367|nr:Sec-independent protein translocase subunit TatA [Streptomyces sp. CB02959]PJN39074.1 twin-arginine translocase TatA/TatE family subunit [Streptomyces sp. CB02959]